MTPRQVAAELAEAIRLIDACSPAHARGRLAELVYRLGFEPPARPEQLPLVFGRPLPPPRSAYRGHRHGEHFTPGSSGASDRNRLAWLAATIAARQLTVRAIGRELGLSADDVVDLAAGRIGLSSQGWRRLRRLAAAGRRDR